MDLSCGCTRALPSAYVLYNCTVHTLVAIRERRLTQLRLNACDYVIVYLLYFGFRKCDNSRDRRLARHMHAGSGAAVPIPGMRF
jgi:hypothetical protein